MSKILQISLILVLVLSSLGISRPSAASVIVTRTSVEDISDGRALLRWSTSEPSKGRIYYGLDRNDLNINLGFSLFKYNHELILNGLKKDKTYYYKIVVEDRKGFRKEVLLQSFSTRNMGDTIRPKFTYKAIEQATTNAVAVRWNTNEDTKSVISYGTNSKKLDKKVTFGSFNEEHIKYIYGLTPQTRYHLKIEIIDRGKNTFSHTFEFVTLRPDILVDGSDFRIFNVEPNGFDVNLITATSATIKWRTSLVARSYVIYGTKPKRLGKATYVGDKEFTDYGEVTLNDLQPNTTYYFKIVAGKSLYNKSTRSDQFIFTTLPIQRVLGIKILNSESDSDADGLSDEQENALGTDPLDNDSDNDGYNDGLEVENKYNPLGYGRLASQIYANPSLVGSHEDAKAAELKSLLTSKIGAFNSGFRNWFVLTNAYTYGNYSLNDITQAIKHSGRTVHPSIPWTAWKNTLEYKEYIVK